MVDFPFGNFIRLSVFRSELCPPESRPIFPVRTKQKSFPSALAISGRFRRTAKVERLTRRGGSLACTRIISIGNRLRDCVCRAILLTGFFPRKRNAYDVAKSPHRRESHSCARFPLCVRVSRQFILSTSFSFIDCFEPIVDLCFVRSPLMWIAVLIVCIDAARATSVFIFKIVPSLATKFLFLNRINSLN